MRIKKKKAIVSVLAITGILSLSGCIGDYDNIMGFISAEWRWWNILLAILLVLLIIFTVLLIDTIFRGGKKLVGKVIVQTQASSGKLEDAINKVTEETLNKSLLTMDPKFSDFKIPLGETIAFSIEEIDKYIANKKNFEKVEASGKKPTSYKINGGKSFTLLIDLGNGKYKIILKCGPAYGAKLIEYFDQTVSTSKFPYGIIWFSVTNEIKQPSLELIKQLIDISYEIAKIGH
ncbi:MAG: MmcQ/YjbR family DNA-binding protein [Erysipelotrichales bacterium]|nr:MmcQ/YjbR family DNA-binding protein [Erysipelotrichales bacterium]